MGLIARITTDAAGRLADDSTCTIDGVIAPVPVRHAGGGFFAPRRIAQVIHDMGYRPATNYSDDITIEAAQGVRFTADRDLLETAILLRMDHSAGDACRVLEREYGVRPEEAMRLNAIAGYCLSHNISIE